MIGPRCWALGIALGLLPAIVSAQQPALVPLVAPPAAPLVVEAPATASADGSTVLAVKVSGGPGPREKELSRFPDQPWLRCDGAATLAPEGSVTRILVPARPAAHALKCTLRLRGEERALQIRLTVPKPGLYAEVSNPQPFARGPPLTLRPFVVGRGGRIETPGFVRIHASSGRLEAAQNASWLLHLPDDRAPRALVVVLTDGDRHGALFVPVVARTRLPVETRRRTSVEVRVAGRTFGPHQAPRGRVTVPLEIPLGVSHAVVRATDRLGNVTEVPVELHTPVRPRLAAVLAGKSEGTSLAAGHRGLLVVAMAAPDGSPAPDSTRLVATATRGRLQDPVRYGPGLWTFGYEAPATRGKDEITVRSEGDPSSGRVVVEVDVVLGPPAQLQLQLPTQPLRPGERATIPFTVRDRAGNPLPGASVTATLEGSNGDIDTNRNALEVVAPTRLPADRTLRIAVSSGAARESIALALRSGPPQSVEMTVVTEPREARVTLSVRDQYGNAVGPDDFVLRSSGGQTTRLEPQSGAFVTTLRPDPSARSVRVTVVAGDRVLGETSVGFAPPHSAWRLGASVLGGYAHNGGVVQSPRVVANFELRTGVGTMHLGARTGMGWIRHRDLTVQTIAGAQREIQRRLDALTVPLLLVVGVPLSGSWDLSVAVGPSFTYASTVSEPLLGFQEPVRYAGILPGMRVELTVEVRVGPGRAVLAATYGRTRLEEPPITGEIDGFSALLGYIWWFADLGG